MFFDYKMFISSDKLEKWDTFLYLHTCTWHDKVLLWFCCLFKVLVRMKQYRDELLASCLTFILALPKEVIVDQMVDVVPAIQVLYFPYLFFWHEYTWYCHGNSSPVQLKHQHFIMFFQNNFK